MKEVKKCSECGQEDYTPTQAIMLAIAGLAASAVASKILKDGFNKFVHAWNNRAI